MTSISNTNLYTKDEEVCVLKHVIFFWKEGTSLPNVSEQGYIF